MGIRKTIAIYTRVASNAPVIIWPSIATASTGRVQSAVFSVMATTSPITKDVRSTRTCKRRPTPSPNQTVYSSRPHQADNPYSARSIICSNHLKKSSYYTYTRACPTCQPIPTAVQRHFGTQKPCWKPFSTKWEHRH
jgi:hypothetical protein